MVVFLMQRNDFVGIERMNPEQAVVRAPVAGRLVCFGLGRRDLALGTRFETDKDYLED